MWLRELGRLWLALLHGTVVRREWQWVRSFWSDEEISWLGKGVLSSQYSDPLRQQWLLFLKVSCQPIIAQTRECLFSLKVLDDQWKKTSWLLLTFALLQVCHRDIITGATWTPLLSRSAASLCLIPFVSVTLGSVKLIDKLLTSVKLSELKFYNVMSKKMQVFWWYLKLVGKFNWKSPDVIFFSVLSPQ